MRTAPRLAALVPLALVLLPAPGSAGSGCAQAVATVALAGFPPQATSQPFYDAVEGSGPASFTVQTGGHACGVEVSVRYVVESDPADTATPGEDYEPKAGRTEDLNVDHRQGEYEWQTVPVPVMDDAVVESPVESARVVLSEPQGGTLKRPSSAPLYLVDDDGEARVAVGPGPFSAAEGTTAMIPVFRAGDAGGSVTVDSAVERVRRTPPPPVRTTTRPRARCRSDPAAGLGSSRSPSWTTRWWTPGRPSASP